MADLSKSL
jgi:hypothetical protein